MPRTDDEPGAAAVQAVTSLELDLEAQRGQGTAVAEQLAAAQEDAKAAREALRAKEIQVEAAQAAAAASAQDVTALVADTVGLEKQVEAAQAAHAASAQDVAALVADTAGLEEEVEALRKQLGEAEATVRRQEAEALAWREATKATPAPVAAPAPAPVAIESSNEWQSPNIFHHCVSVQLHSVRGLPWDGERHKQLVFVIKAGKERHEVPIRLDHEIDYRPPPAAGAAPSRLSTETGGDGDEEACRTPPRYSPARGAGLGSPPSATAPLPSAPPARGREGEGAASLSARIDIMTAAQLPELELRLKGRHTGGRWPFVQRLFVQERRTQRGPGPNPGPNPSSGLNPRPEPRPEPWPEPQLRPQSLARTPALASSPGPNPTSGPARCFAGARDAPLAATPLLGALRRAT